MFPLRPADQLAILTGSILLVAYLVRQILRVRAVRIAVARTRRVSEESNNPAREKDKEAIRRYKDEKSSARREDYRNAFPDLTNPIVTLDQIQQIRYDKELYHQLQNLEDHPDALPNARQRLMTLFDQTMGAAQASPSGSILSIPSYSPAALQQWLHQGHLSNTAKYEAYLARRKAGGPREIFPDRDYAMQWLKVAAVVKYVDGGWIANVLNYDTESLVRAEAKGDYHIGAERRAAKLAWQIVSEEFGDGDLAKNHVYVYNELLKTLDSEGIALTGDQPNFDRIPDEKSSIRCWTAAIAQQCIGSLSSTGDYFPEALGFNMAYETLPYHLCITSRELRELKVDDYYFALHITIDNFDSGHGAMARVAVERYLETVRERDGQAAMEKMWRRVQAGVVLADGLPTTPASPVDFTLDHDRRWIPATSSTVSTPPPTEIESRMITLLHRKSAAAEKMHCPSRITIKGQTIEHWLDPSSFTPEKGLIFLRALSEKKPWVVPGQSARSKLAQELDWGGRMFGAFSQEETKLVKKWIDSLGREEEGAGAYRRFVGPIDKFAPTSRPVSIPTNRISTALDRCPTPQHTFKLSTLSPPNFPAQPNLQRLAAIWFTSQSLLETFQLSPTKFASPLGSAVLRIVRAQLGLPAFHRREDICAGMDGIFTDDQGIPADVPDLWNVGVDIFSRLGVSAPRTYSELEKWVREDMPGSEFCSDMIEFRARPYGQQAILLGMTWCFAQYLATPFEGSMSEGEKEVVQRIGGDSIAAIEDLLKEEEQEQDAEWWMMFVRGYERARMELEKS